MKNVLVIGGSYFVGRIFSMVALQEGWHLTLINRGTYSLKELGDVTEFSCDRYDYNKLKSLPLKEKYDAVVDFCAYDPGDIENMIKTLPCQFNKYIYISTVDVCESSSDIRDENSPLQWREPTDEVSLYTYNKMLLEKEIAKAAESYDFKYTILRPAMIYGPYNYAPRESWYIEQIIRGDALPHPVDADGQFQMVYAKDVARGIMLCIEKEEADNKTYVLSAPEVFNYDRYVDLLREVSGRKIETLPVTVEEVLRMNIPLPFPLTSEENALFNGEKIVKELGFEYGDLKTSMQMTYNAFKTVFE